MPHKINPIDFENAEGNLELRNTRIFYSQTSYFAIAKFARAS